ncbi:MAG: sugar kinase [Cyclobacteriaceae bacterium]
MQTDEIKRVVTFGEVMMRLSPPGYAKFSQTNTLELAYGGGEANVAISLAYLGYKAKHITRFPDNLIGRAAAQFLRHNWLDTSHVIYGDQRMGQYFLEKGAVHRASEVVYERENSAFAKLKPEMFDWEEILEGADWFHWTGITPAISQGTADACLEAIKTANRLGISVSADVNSRKSLWQYGKSRHDILPDLIAGCDVLMASEYDLIDIFQIPMDATSTTLDEVAKEVANKIPRVKKIFDKTRELVSASHNRIKGRMWNGTEFFETSSLDVTHIVDRVGTGDAYCAGVIYGLLHYQEDQQALKFATAACALKHTVEGDANMVSFENVRNLAEGDTSGKIKR